MPSCDNRAAGRAPCCAPQGRAHAPRTHQRRLRSAARLGGGCARAHSGRGAAAARARAPKLRAPSGDCLGVLRARRRSGAPVKTRRRAAAGERRLQTIAACRGALGRRGRSRAAGEARKGARRLLLRRRARRRWRSQCRAIAGHGTGRGHERDWGKAERAERRRRRENVLAREAGHTPQAVPAAAQPWGQARGGGQRRISGAPRPQRGHGAPHECRQAGGEERGPA